MSRRQRIVSKIAERKKAFTLLGAVVGVCAFLFVLYWTLYGSRYVSTDNAYTATEVAQVTPEVDGTIKAVNVVDTNSVKAGDVLVEIDPRDMQVAYDKAKANYDRAKIDYDRRLALAASGSVSADELTRSENELAQTSASFREATLNLERTTIKAPIDGVIAKRQVQLGQRVRAGTPLMVVVPLHDLHVDANFKENELENIRVGQKVRLTADLYGGRVVYQGVVDGFSGGTGAAFAAIPAQNATGNWIKVVQRVPVRIRLQPEELAANPLSVGVSMRARIDTRSD
ncbi:MAG: efflux RND transporter periplasmic adaptor subunit [Fluviibacter sp.]|jgi:membrane fusion protein (multidrug efflux system)